MTSINSKDPGRGAATLEEGFRGNYDQPLRVLLHGQVAQGVPGAESRGAGLDK